MPVETIYIARHGYRLSWEDEDWTSPTGTPRDSPLSPHGRCQAVALASYLAKLIPKADAIISSPYYRCLETANEVAKILDLPISVEHGLSEFYLPAPQGKHPSCLAARQLRDFFPAIDPSHSSFIVPPCRGETAAEVHQRSLSLLQLLLKNMNTSSNAPKTVMLVTHAATAIALTRALVNDPEKEVKAGTCSLTTCSLVSTKEDARGGLGEWDLKDNGNVSFLDKGEERHWDFSFITDPWEEGIVEAESS